MSVTDRSDRKVQETTIPHDLSKIEQQYECSICLNWLDEPVLTRCGHRFCKKCIEPCLKTSKQCPLDSVPLDENNLFPDNFTLREIRQILVPCPHQANGCQKRMSPYELESHIVTCKYGQENVEGGSQSTEYCSFQSCGCNFKSSDSSEIETHIQQDMPVHLNLLLTAFTQKKVMALKSIEAKNMWDAPSKSAEGQNGSSNANTDRNTNSNNDALLSALYERIVVLEQLNREQALKIDKLSTQLNRSVTNLNDMQSRYSGGVLLWKITHFRSRVQAMIKDPGLMDYSGDFYTGPFGYRFCARINVSQKATHSIGLHLHMMQSDNDYHLDWPFRGCLKIWMIHRDSNSTRSDKIMSNEKILAFAQPTSRISPRGFGYIEYANIAEIVNRGFVPDDTLTIKCHISIV